MENSLSRLFSFQAQPNKIFNQTVMVLHLITAMHIVVATPSANATTKGPPATRTKNPFAPTISVEPTVINKPTNHTSCYAECFFLSYTDLMKDSTGEELIAIAGATSIKIAECMDLEELGAFAEFLGLLKHDLEIIKIRRFIKKVEEKKETKK